MSVESGIPDWSDSDRIIKSQTPTTNDPSIRRMLSELPYSEVDGLRDLTDNSLASADQHNMSQVSIEYVLNIDTDSQENSILAIRDNAGGIPKDPAIGERGIHEALGLDSPMEYERGEYNRYGLGMKGAIHSLGSLSKLYTNPIHEENAYIVPGPWSLVDFDIRESPTGTSYEFPMGDHGTIIEIDNLSDEVWSQRPKQTAKSLQQKLEAIYRHRLAGTSWGPNVKMNAKFVAYKDGEKVYESILKPAWPPKFDYESGQPLNGNEFHIEVTVQSEKYPEVRGTFRLSYAPDDDTYEMYGDSWYDEKGHPYTKSGDDGAGIKHQGIDFVFKGRVVEHNKLFEMAILDKSPNSGYNLVTGEAHIEGLEVSTIKNGLEENDALKDLFERMMQKVEENFDSTYFQYDRTTGEEVEAVYMDFLKNGKHGFNVQSVENNEEINGQFTDLLVKEEEKNVVIEVKASQIEPPHVKQAVFYAIELTSSENHEDYYDIRVAGDSSTLGARTLRDNINNEYSMFNEYNVEFINHGEFLPNDYYKQI